MIPALTLLALAALDPPATPPLTAAQREGIAAARKQAEAKAAPVAARLATAVRGVTDNMLADAPDPVLRQKLADEMRSALGEAMLAKGQLTWDVCQLLTADQRRSVRAAMARSGAPADPGEVIEAVFGRDEPAKPRPLTADDVVRQWSPKLPGATEFGQLGGSPKQSPHVAAYTFRVTGPTVEQLWTHYADRCGVTKRYAEKRFLVTADAGRHGSYVVADRPAADGMGGRGPSVFLLTTKEYTVTVTFQPDPGGKSVSGSISAVVP